MQISRSWTFTIFNILWDIKNLQDERIKCAVVQKEKCPDSGREHFQGYLQLLAPSRLNAVKKILNEDTAHLEVRKGTPQQAWDYCTKEESRVDGPWTFGDRPAGQGKRCVTKCRSQYYPTLCYVTLRNGVLPCVFRPL